MRYTTEDEAPTLRLTTLRTLVRHAPPLAVVPLSTPLTDLAEILLDHRVWIVVVDAAGMLTGVLSGEDALRALKCDPDGWVADHMERSSILMGAEADIEDAWAAARAEDASHVLVASAHGDLLGVIQTPLLATYRRAA